MEMVMFIFGLIGVVVVLALIVAIGAYYYGKVKEKNKISQANLEASQKAKETKKVIQELSDAELDAAMRKRVQSKRSK
jgi:Tfp pilus assembly major pilin PilA